MEKFCNCDKNENEGYEGLSNADLKDGKQPFPTRPHKEKREHREHREHKDHKEHKEYREHRDHKDYKVHRDHREPREYKEHHHHDHHHKKHENKNYEHRPKKDYKNKDHHSKNDKNRDERPDTSHLGIFDVNLSFYELKGTKSKITCHARPRDNNIKEMVEKHGVNFILSIQSDKENPTEIEEKCKQLNIQWKRVDLYGANMRLFGLDSTVKLFVKTIMEIYEILLKQEVTLFVHCAFGLHRTGTMVYTILRTFGENRVSAMEAIKKIRLATFENVGDKRLDYADQKLIPEIAKALLLMKLGLESDSKIEVKNNVNTEKNVNFVDINKEDEESSSGDEIEDFYYTNENNIDNRENIYIKK